MCGRYSSVVVRTKNGSEAAELLGKKAVAASDTITITVVQEIFRHMNHCHVRFGSSVPQECLRLTFVANTFFRFSFMELLLSLRWVKVLLTLCVTAIHCQALPLVDSPELHMTLAL